jgi:hypothetical protein
MNGSLNSMNSTTELEDLMGRVRTTLDRTIKLPLPRVDRPAAPAAPPPSTPSAGPQKSDPADALRAQADFNDLVNDLVLRVMQQILLELSHIERDLTLIEEQQRLIQSSGKAACADTQNHVSG